MMLVANPKATLSQPILLTEDKVGLFASKITCDECSFLLLGSTLAIVNRFLGNGGLGGRTNLPH